MAIPPGIVHDELRECVELLDRIHGVHQLPRIRFSLGHLPPAEIEGLARRGRFAFSRGGDAESITVDSRLPNRELTALHEIGHFLDLNGIGQPRRWESLTVGGLLQDWRAAVQVSAAVDRLNELADSNDPVIAQVSTNALDWRELWSRSYAQFVVNRADSVRLVSQLEAHRIPSATGIYLPLQWGDEDFVATDLAIENLFRRIGWRTV